MPVERRGGRLRCAIYTRKSTEEGLEQDFNSLHAQREACAAYIASQAGEGWSALATAYDDGGHSGGTMERPSLARLLDDVEAGLIDVVVVYKVDRLTRSLSDFARIVERFDARGVSFVSVTQAFNTTTSMGRLTLNVLLSFAQFEREVTAERIRDKIAASKRKGMWMGGLAPLGYDARERRLVVNAAEADTVSFLFRTYLEVGSLRRLKEVADTEGILTKRREWPDRTSGGVAFTVGHLRQLLANPVYVGKVRHGGAVHDGQHEAIVDVALFAAVQAQLAAGTPPRRARPSRAPHLFSGRVFDETGDRLTSTHANRSGRRYHYYVSRRLTQGRATVAGGWRLAAGVLDGAVVNVVRKILRDPAQLVDRLAVELDAETIELMTSNACRLASQPQAVDEPPPQPLLQIVVRITVAAERLMVELSRPALVALLLEAVPSKASALAPEGDETFTIRVPWQVKRRGVEKRIVLDSEARVAAADPHLVSLIGRAHRILAQLTNGKAASIDAAAAIVGIDRIDASRILPLAFLAPDITRAIVAGRAPAELTATALGRIRHLPTDWSAQRRLLGFAQPR